jgi:hypothetical protein
MMESEDKHHSFLIPVLDDDESSARAGRFTTGERTGTHWKNPCAALDDFNSEKSVAPVGNRTTVPRSPSP